MTSKGAGETGEVRFDANVFDELAGMVGPAVLESIVAKFEGELDTRFSNLTPDTNPTQIAKDAHAMVSSAGMLGFVRLIAILRELEFGKDRPIAIDQLLSDLAAELRLVADDLRLQKARLEANAV